uniref:Uncharacterized protein n=1 Tax=Oryza barthii TaxID=65489 RepID=A0A0D3HUK1_9ORYZ
MATFEMLQRQQRTAGRRRWLLLAFGLSKDARTWLDQVEEVVHVPMDKMRRSLPEVSKIGSNTFGQRNEEGVLGDKAQGYLRPTVSKSSLSSATSARQVERRRRGVHQQISTFIGSLPPKVHFRGVPELNIHNCDVP